MGRFTVIPQDTFEGLQLDAGVVLKKFNPAKPTDWSDADIVCATTGGISVSAVPAYSDLGEDVDNCPINMKELKHLDSWDCKLGFTSLGTSPESIRLSLGAADVYASSGKIVPRRDLKQTDFSDLWWVGDRADGGFVACKVKNALSTSGFSLQTGKNAKGQTTVELTGHVSIDAQDEMPMEFYSIDPSEVTSYTVKQILAHVSSSFNGNSIDAGEAFAATITADDDYTVESVVVTMGGEDITDTAYTSATGEIAIASVDGDIMVVATATASI